MQRLFCIFVKKKIFANYSIESIFSICSNCIDIIYKTSTKLCYKYLNESCNTATAMRSTNEFFILYIML